jgi:hypothetical protein
MGGLQLHKLELLLADGLKQTVLFIRKWCTVRMLARSHDVRSSVCTYYLSFLLGLELLVEFAQAGCPDMVGFSG